jgi:hypothetical protein
MPERSERDLRILRDLREHAYSRVADGDERARILLAAVEQLIVEREQRDGDEAASPRPDGEPRAV